uniref:Uncharacterized protein n=1 Tax=Arundo donax TaxID=35708 RepID=A0A0A8YSS6_ARUDO
MTIECPPHSFSGIHNHWNHVKINCHLSRLFLPTK